LDFRQIKDKEEQRQMDMEDLEWEEYNEPYKLEELEYAFGSSDGSSPGPDGIHYHAKKELLKSYNQVWEGRAFPEE
jgi:hypothetical protein